MRLYKHQERLIIEARPVLEKYGFVLVIAMQRCGKTLTAIHLAEKYGQCLVLTKKAAMSSWEDDLTLSGYRDKFTVINYESAHKTTADSNIVICDESHSCGLSSYPKPSVTVKKVRRLTVGKPIIFLTATPQAESGSQWYHQLAVSDNSPFRKYRNFYRWFDEYGIPELIYLHNRQVKSYKIAQEDRIMEVLKPYLVTLSQQEAGFNIKAKNEYHYIQNQNLIEFCNRFKRDKVIRIKGMDVVAATPATLVQRLHQFCGGIAYGEDDKEAVLSHYKAEYLKRLFDDLNSVVVLCNYILERKLLLDYLSSATESIEDFKSGDHKYFIGNIKKYSEGVDFSYADTMVIYSLNFSATTYLQSRERLCNKKRVEPVVVHYLIARGTIDEYVLKAVLAKRNFTSKFYIEEMKR